MITLTLIIFGLSILAIAIAGYIIGYQIGKKDGKAEAEKINSPTETLDKIQKIIDDEYDTNKDQ